MHDSLRQGSLLHPNINQQQQDPRRMLVDQKFDADMLDHQFKYVRIKDSLKKKFFQNSLFLRKSVGEPLNFTLELEKGADFKRKGMLGGKRKGPSPTRAATSNRTHRYEGKNTQFEARGEALMKSKANNPQILSLSVQLNRAMKQNGEDSPSRKSARPKITTLSERKNAEERSYNLDRDRIIHKLFQSRMFEKCKGRFDHAFSSEQSREKLKQDDLTSLQRYDIGYGSYLKQKAKRNIEQTIYNQKILPKDTLVARFQAIVLEQANFPKQTRGKLQKAFKNIEKQFHTTSEKRWKPSRLHGQ